MIETFVILAGNVVDGITPYGPFESAEEANEYADRRIACDWVVAKVLAPRKGGRS